MQTCQMVTSSQAGILLLITTNLSRLIYAKNDVLFTSDSRDVVDLADDCYSPADTDCSLFLNCCER